MIPFRTIAQTRTPDGSLLTLHEHDGEHYLKLAGRQLMSTYSTTSELLLGEVACEGLARARSPRVLIGGLGLGFSLKRVLEIVGAQAVVHVAELLPEVIAWNRELLGKVNGRLLDDPRVEVFAEDVFKVIRRAPAAPYDAILLDMDNGPTSLVQKGNSRIYERQGFARIARALVPGGRVAFWAATEEPGFVTRLSKAGFRAEAIEAKAHPTAKRAAHRIYVGTLLEDEPPVSEPGASARRRPVSS